MDSSTKDLFIWLLNIGKSIEYIDKVIDRLDSVIEDLKEDPDQRDNQTSIEWIKDELTSIKELLELEKLDDLR